MKDLLNLAILCAIVFVVVFLGSYAGTSAAHRHAEPVTVGTHH